MKTTARILIGIVALMMVGSGLIYMFNPDAVLSTTQITHDSLFGRANIRANMGGPMVTFGLFLAMGAYWARKDALLPFIVFATLAVLALAACEAESPSPTKPEAREPASSTRAMPKHVLLLSMDTLRADRVGAYGYDRPTTPTIDELARRGALFKNAQAPRGATWPTLTSLLTGKHPISHGVRSNGVRPEPLS